jgi:hypothetical protein
MRALAEDAFANPDRRSRRLPPGKIPAPAEARKYSLPRHKPKKVSFRLTDSLPGTWLRDKELVRSHHLSGQKDSGYTANSIASGHHTFRGEEVNLRREKHGENGTR